MVYEVCTKEQISYKLTFGAQTYQKSDFIEIEKSFYRKSYQIVPFDRVLKMYSDVDKNKLYQLLDDKNDKFLVEFLSEYHTSGSFSIY